mgnify:CR=1 FL=1
MDDSGSFLSHRVFLPVKYRWCVDRCILNMISIIFRVTESAETISIYMHTHTSWNPLSKVSYAACRVSREAESYTSASVPLA